MNRYIYIYTCPIQLVCCQLLVDREAMARSPRRVPCRCETWSCGKCIKQYQLHHAQVEHFGIWKLVFMCMYMYVYVFLCMYMYLYVCICISMYFFACLCISLHFYVFLCMSMHFYVFLCIYVKPIHHITPRCYFAQCKAHVVTSSAGLRKPQPWRRPRSKTWRLRRKQPRRRCQRCASHNS